MLGVSVFRDAWPINDCVVALTLDEEVSDFIEFRSLIIIEELEVISLKLLLWYGVLSTSCDQPWFPGVTGIVRIETEFSAWWVRKIHPDRWTRRLCDRWIPRISAGVCGRCCQLAPHCWYRSEGLLPDLSLGFCAIEIDPVQLRPWCFFEAGF